MSIQRTFAMLKPGVLQRRLLGEIITRLEKKGFLIRAMKLRMLDRPLLEQHYGEHKGKDFYEPLLEYMTKGPVLTMVLEGPNAIPLLRTITGPTVVDGAQAGTIRGDLCIFTRFNLIHASDSEESADREIELFFEASDILEFDDPLSDWLYDRG